ncbi:hypothetical protein [Subtercola boreus]|uniref:Uncharacterized protein n=1 Tax=Subtercola boreus TaxID=120213 RepID=A0A3E0WB86_9MICO|nr:hypothetical protein [Subtercola boreus]RFA19487.1 hypothetical protein B7R24_11440 [Subtercola boreus]RFA19748.1 hypothetical protein B7R23_11420 [Subtercola boreus]RFA26114.1 hypothetical protein B7R25_11540 [Subtercola boreus]
MDACAELATLAGRLAVGETSPRRFLVRLGEEGGGIRRGALWMIDATLAGRNRLPGRGFSPALDDGSTGQARHFAGTAAAAARLGAAVTRWVSVHVRRDPLDSADGRLSEEAIRFAALVRSGDLPLAETEAWIREHLCA